MTRARVAVCVLGAVLLAGYLHDPPWAGQITSGLLEWEDDAAGTLFRWTLGRASFFVPSDATAMTLPMRAIFPGPAGSPTTVGVFVDDRWLADVKMDRPDEWVRPVLPLPGKRTGRRFRRVDLHVNRVAVGDFILGVQTGEIALDRGR
jgi:hypothetical protein